MNKILAFICTLCPVCIYGRWRPESKLAKAIASYQKYCPACRAYKKLHG